jgi:hypothetical protein
MFENLVKVLPHIAFIAAVCLGLGWTLRGLFTKPAAGAKSTPTIDSGKQDRVKNLEAALEKSRASHKETESELEALQASSVSKAALEASTAELGTARKELDGVGKRISALEADLKKSQETIKHLNSRANDVDKAQKDRSFALENELSKTREQLAILQNRPDDSTDLQAEIERLRESVAVSTRYAGEMRKREAAAAEALEKAEARLAEAGTARPAPTSKKIGPVADSGRIAAAKAEVLRLVEQNKAKAAAAVAIAPLFPTMETLAESVPDEPVSAIEEPVAVVEEHVAAIEEPAVAIEEPVVDREEAGSTIEAPVAVVEETAEVTEEPVTTLEEPVEVDEEIVAVVEEPIAPDEDPAAEPEKVATATEEPKKPVAGELFPLD